MDNKIKEQIDAIFAKHPGNMICLEMYGDQDYDGIATQREWDEWMERFDNEIELEQAPKGFPIKKAAFANLGFDYDSFPADDIPIINDLSGLICSVLPWEMEDFNGEVNHYWYGLVVVTRDYKVLRVTSDGTSLLYRSEIGDLSKMGSQEEEIEKLALASIKESVGNILSKFKSVVSDKGKSQVFGMVEDLDRAITKG